MTDLSKRDLLYAAAGSGALVLSRAAPAQTPAPAPATSRPPPQPPIPPDEVKAFVRDAHSDFTAVRAHLARQPALLNAAWDWGAGDYETAIGAAGHMGRRDIAEFLIEQGARVDVFVAAMLGNLAVVRDTLTAWPALARSKGPHGISLLRHAQAGGAQARGVVDYLQSLPTG